MADYVPGGELSQYGEPLEMHRCNFELVFSKLEFSEKRELIGVELSVISMC